MNVICNYINIDFCYLSKGCSEWVKLSIRPDEYFDIAQLEKNELLDIDSIPIYDNLLDYLPESIRNEIINISLIISNSSSQSKLWFSQYLWNNQENYNLDRKEYKKDNLVYHEIIISTIVPSSIAIYHDNVYEILRFVYSINSVDSSYHAFIIDKPDGSQEEILIS